MAKNDPLATQIWKMYSKDKLRQPQSQRMENLTWRMMALRLKKPKKEDDSNERATSELSDNTTSSTSEEAAAKILSERGRKKDKGKAKVTVVGFDGVNQDGPEEPEDE
jgi:hypothetical protein